MSEEEIIESVKYHILLEYQGFCNIDKASLQGLLDLYNKEKEKNKEMFSQYEKRVNELEREIAINSISKDKIREKIKELDNIPYAECIERAEEDIELLKELLEEE